MSTEHQSHFWSRFMLVLWVLLAVLILPVPLLMQHFGMGDDMEVVLVLVWLVVFVIAVFSFRHYVAERHRNIILTTPPAVEVLKQDRPAIVYLRSFDDEQSILKRYRRAWPTEEEQVTAAFEPYGPLIAIHNPATELPAPGAARLSASNDTWKDEVRKRVDEAAFVIVRLGDSPGVLWELNLVIRRLPPSRVLLLSALTANAHTRASAILEEEFGIRLPRHTKQLSAITFDSDWRPTIRLLHKWNLRGDFRTPYLQVALQAALVPFFHRLGFDAELPPVRASRIVSMVFFLLVLFILCAGFLFFPISILLTPDDGLTMTAGVVGLIVGATIGGIITAVVLVGLIVQNVKEIWFPEHLVSPTIQGIGDRTYGKSR